MTEAKQAKLTGPLVRLGVFAGVLVLAAIVFIPLASSQGTAPVKAGSVVTIQYAFTANGQDVVTQKNKEMMQLVVGRNYFPPTFENQLVGLKAGDKKTIRLTPAEAFGETQRDKIIRIPKTAIPANIELKEGAVLAGAKGKNAMRIAQILPDSVILDQNHPLAGKTLEYQVQVMDVQ